MEYTYSTRKTNIRGLEVSDAEKILEFYNDKQLLEGATNSNEILLPHTISQVEEFISKSETDREQYLLGIEQKGTPKLIGFICITPQLVNRCASIFVCISPDFWGNDYGTEVMGKTVEIVFEQFNMRKISFDVSEENKKAIRCGEKNGFTIEATKKEEIYQNGSYRDLIFMSLFRKDWEEKNKK